MSARMRLTAKHGGQRDGDDGDEDRDRAPQRGANQPHGLAHSPGGRDQRPTNERQVAAAPPPRAEQRPPDVDARDGILILGLREQALRVGHFDDARQAGL